MTFKPEVNLWLDDVRKPLIGYQWAKTYAEAIEILQKYRVVRCSLDHDLSFEHYQSDNVSGYTEKTGYDVVKWMEENDCWPEQPPIVHSFNPIGAKKMADVLARHYGCSPLTLLRPYRHME